MNYSKDTSFYNIAPRDEPDIRGLFDQMESSLNYAGGRHSSFLARQQAAYDTVKCYWSQQNADGRKHDTESSEADPYDGCSDARVRVAEIVVTERTHLLSTAFASGKVSVTPSPAVATSTPGRAAVVLGVLNSTLDQMGKAKTLAVRQFARCREQYGHSVMRVGWQTVLGVEKIQISRMDLLGLALNAELIGVGLPSVDDAKAAQENGGLQPGQMEAMTRVTEMTMDAFSEILHDPERHEDLASLIVQHDPAITPEEARRVMSGLREEAEVPYWARIVQSDMPVWTALQPFVDIFYPHDTECVQTARWVAQIHWLSRVELEAQAAVEQWDTDWLAEVLKRPGRAFDSEVFTSYGWALGGLSVKAEVDDNSCIQSHLYQIMEVHYRAIALHGAPCVYRTVVHGAVRNGYAIHGVTPDHHGRYPYVDSRHEIDGVSLLACRGIPEIISTQQDAIKSQHDSRRNRTELATNPPAVVPQFRAGARYRIGPGAQIPERRTGSFHYLPIPPMDVDTAAISRAEWDLIDNYFGRFSPAVPQPITQLHQQAMVMDFLGDMTEIVQMTFDLLQQHRTDAWTFSVTGVDAPFHASPEDIRGRHAFTISFDPMGLSQDWLSKKLELIGKLIPFDVQGDINRTALLNFAFTAVDPGLSAQVIRQRDTVMVDQIKDERTALTAILTGQEPDYQMGKNHAALGDWLVEQAGKSPTIRKKLEEDETVRALFEARVGFHRQQVVQQENVATGMRGVKTVLN